MIMSKRAEKALRKSIEHWKVDVFENDCKNCPINKADKPCGFYGSPYRFYMPERILGKDSMSRKRKARAMIKFMEGLLP